MALILALCCFPVLYADAADGEPNAVDSAPRSADPSEIAKLIWSGSDQASVVFIPAKLLGSVPLSELPIRSTDRMILLEAVDRARSLDRENCPASGEVVQQGTDAETQSLEEFISFFKVSFVGEVTSLEMGWSPWLAEPAELATVRVEKEIHSKVSGGPQPGEVVSILIQGGEFVYKGVLLCEPPHEELYRPAVGDRILAVGSPWWDPRFFSAAIVFPVEDDLVHLQPLPQIDAHAIPEPVELVRTKIEKEMLRQQDAP